MRLLTDCGKIDCIQQTILQRHFADLKKTQIFKISKRSQGKRKNSKVPNP